MTTDFSIRSVKAKQTVRGTLAEAIAAAIRHEDDYQPAFGVDVLDGDVVVAEVRDGEVEHTVDATEGGAL